MNIIDENKVANALATIADPEKDGDIIAGGRIAGIVVKDQHIHIMLDIEGLEPDKADALRKICEEKVAAIKGALSATCIMTAHKKEGAQEQEGKPRPDANREVPAIFNKIKKVIAVASGKGGVGKSTVAVNLALALQQQGLQVGLLDADIYGPSMPQLLGITTRPDTTDEKKLIPIEVAGVATMSIGYMVPPEQAMIWRGPMVQSALLQMLNDVAWQPLDVLIIDMPPGTGDIQLTMAQRIPVSGVVVVSTPAEIALADVRRAVEMFRVLETPIIGLVNNMAYMETGAGTSRLYPFGEKTAAGIAEAIGIENNIHALADIPLEPTLQKANDDGTPLLIEKPDSPIAHTFRTLAKEIWDRLKS
ncbi:MAG: Mrp/NBP35 family ATP-binding protein [Alphaproteobacteria bacterium]|nr:Mrp/NBP35 family ATP-binding protein [Alphaproteobacteria bacterium]